MYEELFKELDNYLDKINPPKVIKLIPCCDNPNVRLNPDILLYSCSNCASVCNNTPYHKDFYDKYKIPNCVKSYIPYNSKLRHLHRINKWTNYSYKEINMNKLLKYIDNKLEGYDREVIMFSRVLFKQIYEKLTIRAKIKDGLIVYCYFCISLSLNKEVDIDELLNVFNINIKNYNDLNKKLKSDRLFYPYDLNKYLKLSNMESYKNRIIKMYNLFLSFSKRRFMKKSIVLGLIYHLVKDEDIKKRFYKIFNISRNSIRNILCNINKFDSILF